MHQDNFSQENQKFNAETIISREEEDFYTVAMKTRMKNSKMRRNKTLEVNLLANFSFQCTVITTILLQLIIAQMNCLPSNNRKAEQEDRFFQYQENKELVSGQTLEFEAHQSNDSLVQKLLLQYPTDKNQKLLQRLEKRQFDYQILYPVQETSGGFETLAKDNNNNHQKDNREEESSAFRGSNDDDDDEKPEVVVTNHRFRRQQQGNRPNKANQVLGHYNRTNVVIKAFNYKFRLDLELNNNLFGPSLIQKHFLPKGNQQISTQKIEHCYYHARTQPETRPSAIGAFRTCNGLSGIIHANNESFVIHPFYDADFNKKHPHIIYRYQTSLQTDSSTASGSSSNNLAYSQDFNQLSESSSLNNGNEQQQQQTIRRECGNTRLHEWALRQYNKVNTLLKRNSPQPEVPLPKPVMSREVNLDLKVDECSMKGGDDKELTSSCDSTRENLKLTQTGNEEYSPKMVEEKRNRFSKRDVSFTEKYIELALILSQDMFDKRNSSSRLEVLHDAIQIVNCLDLYFRSANTRVALIYIETWAHGDQIEINSDVKQTLYNFLEYSTRKLYKVSMDAVHLLTGGHLKQFDSNEVGMSIPDSVCTSRAVSVSQESNIFEPFIAASTIAHMLGHNLGMEHDNYTIGHQSSVDHAITSQQPPVSVVDLNPTSPKLAGGGSLYDSPPKPPVLHHSPSRTLNNNKAHIGHQNSQDQEEHEDEIKSRSLNFDDEDQFLSKPEVSRDSSSSVAERDVLSQHCRVNCLMSERFTYLQPPVTFGNMVQQQVATSNQTTTTSSQQQEQQNTFGTLDHQHLNGFTMNQIDNELQNERSLFSTTSLPFKFSRQSLETYHRMLRLGHGICLFNKPNQLEDFKTCGNGIVDKGEDCDCGTFQECLESDSCCDPITCRFKADAECINGACCDRCKLRSRGFVCRKSRNECDLAETCDGKSSHCGPDVHKQNGYPCSMGQGYCYLGQCPHIDQQCAELWGLDARKSDRLCYANFNQNGTIRGNCGYDSSMRKYKRCELEHIMCGTLQCQLGDMKPVTAPIDLNSSSSSLTSAATTSTMSSSTFNAANSLQQQQQQTTHEFSKKTIHSLDGNHHECKVITGLGTTSSQHHQHQQQQQLSSISFVREGSKCAHNKVCFNFTCQPLEMVYRDSYELCPHDEKGKQCSGNGICSTANRCHCDEGWLGHDCSQRETAPLPPSSMPTATTAQVDQPPLDSIITQQQMLPPRSGSGGLSGGGTISSDELQLMRPAINGENLPNRPPSERNIVITNGLLLTPASVLAPSASSSSSSSSIISPPLTAAPISATTTTTESTATTTSTGSGGSSTMNPSTVHQDKKKHDALGAPTLVFILVSIVAAVYVGFAIMANCYRRKGFLKPDKVLRHHQMNCKLDALRSSFIAKRLADAEVGVLDPGEPPLVGGGGGGVAAPPNSAEVDPTLGMNPFITQPQPPLPPPLSQCQHTIPSGSVYGMTGTGSGPLDQIGQSYPESSISHYNQGQQKHQQQQQQQFAATVHYFDEQAAGGREQQQQCIHHHQLPLETFSFEQNGSGDHIPLLMGSNNAEKASHHHHHHHLHHHPRSTRPMNQPILRSFNASNAASASGAVKPSSNYKTNTTLLYQTNHQWPNNNSNSRHNHNQQVQHIDHNQQTSINRATSLGNVNGGGQLASRQHLINAQTDDSFERDDEEARRVMATHRALATPSRASARGALLAGPTYHRRSPVEDSCSAPSSPEHRAPYWSDVDRQRRRLLNRQSSTLSSRNANQTTSYHEDLILGAISTAGGGSQHRLNNIHQSVGGKFNINGGSDHLQQHSNAADDDLDLDLDQEVGEDEDLPPLPPPPPPTTTAHHLLVDRNDPESEDSGQSQCHSSGQQHFRLKSNKRQSEPTLPRSPVIASNNWSMRTIKRVPLNSGDSGDEQPEQLSLIAQLQQLERVQQMHQKQVSTSSGGNKTTKSPSTSNAPGNNDGGLHEFFSLPLSVQLSALLTRSLNADMSRDAVQIEDYLNSLNSTNVAASSRRSFKKWSQTPTASSQQQQQQQQTTKDGAWIGGGGGAGKRGQQMKLHNLQGLITRLQKLHSQTMLQQQLDELTGELDDDLAAVGRGGGSSSRHSTLSRSGGHMRSVSRANQTVDDLCTNDNVNMRGNSEHNNNSNSRGSIAGRSNRSSSRYNIGGNKNDSVYSMSDSEDGAFVSRVLTSYQQKNAAATTIGEKVQTSATHNGIELANNQSNQTNGNKSQDQKDERSVKSSTNTTNTTATTSSTSSSSASTSTSSTEANSCVDQVTTMAAENKAQ